MNKIKKLTDFLYQLLVVDQSTNQLSHYKLWTNIGFTVLSIAYSFNFHDIDFFLAYAATVAGAHITNKAVTMKTSKGATIETKNDAE